MWQISDDLALDYQPLKANCSRSSVIMRIMRIMRIMLSTVPAGRRDNLAPVGYVRFDIRPKQPDIIITGKYNPTAEATSYPPGLPKRLRLDNI